MTTEGKRRGWGRRLGLAVTEGVDVRGRLQSRGREGKGKADGQGKLKRAKVEERSGWAGKVEESVAGVGIEYVGEGENENMRERNRKQQRRCLGKNFRAKIRLKGENIPY